MRRLSVLPCPEPWDRMRPDGEGRHCERCRLRVSDVAKLDGEALDELIAAAEGGRVCARFELDGGRPRTRLGLAAGLVVVALAGCAVPIPVTEEPATATLDQGSTPEGSGGAIAGLVSDPDGRPLAQALVILQSSALPHPLERLTSDRGAYSFADLPPGHYTIQVLAGQSDVAKVVELPEDRRFRANFVVDPDREVIMGLLIEHPPLDTSSASSSYSSTLIEYE
ncbi:MAG: carboxypeptidase regulatory-like domain-containing protein [Enhygromyxa sp.]